MVLSMLSSIKDINADASGGGVNSATSPLVYTHCQVGLAVELPRSVHPVPTVRKSPLQRKQQTKTPFKHFTLSHFYTRRQLLLLLSACLSHHNSVRLSVDSQQKNLS